MATQMPQGQFLSLLWLVLLGILFYFLLYRPQKKQQNQQKQMMNSLKLGDKIVTKSGVRGKVVYLDEISFIIETGNNGSQIEYLKNALSYIVTPVAGMEEDFQEEEAVEETSNNEEF